MAATYQDYGSDLRERDVKWTERAACSKSSTRKNWFDWAGNGETQNEHHRIQNIGHDEAELIEACKSICATCPVLAQCKADLVSQLGTRVYAPAGVRAGLDRHEQWDLQQTLPTTCRQCESEVPTIGTTCDKCRAERDAAVAALSA